MADPDKTVFLSYRRDVSGPMAHLVRNDLVRHGFDVFMDVGSLGGGAFEPVILREIEARTHFLVLLEPGSLDRIGEPGDWLRREIAHALTHRRNIVPLLAGGVRMPRCRGPPRRSRPPALAERRHRLPRVPRRGDGEASRLVAGTRPTRSRRRPPRASCRGTGCSGTVLGLPPSALGQPVLAHRPRPPSAARRRLAGPQWTEPPSYDVEQSSTADFIRGAARPPAR